MGKEIRFTGVRRNGGYDLPAKQHLKYLLGLLENANPKSLKMSLANCHAEGLFSLVFSGTESGNLVRAFIAYKEVEAGKIALHSHKYPIKLTTLTTGITHHVATVHDNHKGHISLPKYRYNSSGMGPDRFEHLGNSLITLNDYSIPIGAMIYMEHHQIHTVSCKKGSMWIIQEKGMKEDTSQFLGYPFEQCNLYRKALDKEILESSTYVHNALNNLIRKFGHSS
jgi:hypothetical protein